MSPAFQRPTTIVGWAIYLVILLAVLAVVYVAANAFGLPIPPWLITLVWICVAAAIVVGVLMFLGSLGGGAGP